MKRINPLLLLIGMLAVSGCALEAKPEPYSPELVKKAEAGDAEAQYKLGRSYYHGEGVAKDYKEAFKWITKSAEQGYAYGQYNLGLCYYEAVGIAKDKEEAVRWCTKAAEQGDEDAKKWLRQLKSK